MKTVIFLFLFTASSCFAQSRFVGISSNELSDLFGYSVRKIENGYLIAGRGYSNPNDYLCWISRVDTSLNVVWSRTFELSGDWDHVYHTSIDLAVLPNEQIMLLAKTARDSAYTELIALDQSGNFLWGRKWVHDYYLYNNYDMNRIVSFANSEFIITHSVKRGSMQVRLNPNGTVITSKYLHHTNVSDTSVGVYALHCSDGGSLQIQKHNWKPIIVRLNDQYQVSWSKEIELIDSYVNIHTAFENADGTFWLFGSLDYYAPFQSTDLIYAAILISATGELLDTQIYDSYANVGFSQVFPDAENHFTFTSGEGLIGKIDLGNGLAEMHNVHFSQSDHGWQNMHSLGNEYALTGLGEWGVPKIAFFPSVDDHSCLNSEIYEIEKQTASLSSFNVTNAPFVVENYSIGTSFVPTIGEIDISFPQECYLGTAEHANPFNFTIYPNPSSGLSAITIETIFPAGIQQSLELTITDLQGNRVVHSELNGHTNTHQIDISSLESGLYIVVCYTNDGRIRQAAKLVIH